MDYYFRVERFIGYYNSMQVRVSSIGVVILVMLPENAIDLCIIVISSPIVGVCCM